MKTDVGYTGIVSVREVRDGQYHRRQILPGEDYSTEDAEVQLVCAVAHTSEVVSAFKAQFQAAVLSPEQLLQQFRASAKCSPLQGKLALGQVEWAKIEAYRSTATWAEQIVIDSAQEWRRNSQDIQFFGYLLGYTDEQMDDLFRLAVNIVV